MAQRSTDQGKDHFDLLPFIAILMCVLGCLLLVTMSIAALSIGPGVGEGWIPVRDASAATKIPRLIEWDGTYATFHLDGGRKVRAKWAGVSSLTIGDQTIQLPSAEDKSKDAGKDGEASFQQLLDDLAKQRDTHYALFAVRPSGFDLFNLFAYQFRNRNIDIGYEPIAQDKPVRLLRGKVTAPHE